MVTANAVLTKIQGPGAPDRSGDPAAGPVVWEGRARGYLQRQRRSQVSGGQQLDVRQDSFTMLRGAGAPVLQVAGPDWEATTVVIEDRRTPTAKTRRFTVTAMENSAVDSRVDSIRLELDDETEA